VAADIATRKLADLPVDVDVPGPDSHSCPQETALKRK
jgi:hypothetical protein